MQSLTEKGVFRGDNLIIMSNPIGVCTPTANTISYITTWV